MDILGIDELIEQREMEVECHSCHASNTRTLGWMRNRHETSCDSCGEVIVLGTADLRAQVRNTERLLRVLGQQLTEQLSHHRAGWGG
jgi:ribosomal protein S27E